MLNESRKTRWMILFMASFIMMMGYVFWDIVSPLSTTLKTPIEEGAWDGPQRNMGSLPVHTVSLIYFC